MQLNIVFKYTEKEKKLDEIIGELVDDTIRVVLSKYSDISYNRGNSKGE
ncbi:hypothetical protein [Paenibacillus sp. B2(2019)]|nr:hypothetical protein [Paenibacillus sp. B2(2019)]